MQGTHYGTICTDFYVNQKLALKMDLPSSRETLLDMFDRIKKTHPAMSRFRRYEDELALESPEENPEYCWMAIKQTSVRSGWVNPPDVQKAYDLHRLILETSPYFMSISPLDVAYLELVYGFDLEAEDNRNEIVFDALLGDSPLANLVDDEQEMVVDAQPTIGWGLTLDCAHQASVEIKTRMQPAELVTGQYLPEPISVFLTVRYVGVMHDLEELQTVFGTLAGYAERLAEERVIPHVVLPLRETIISRPGLGGGDGGGSVLS